MSAPDLLHFEDLDGDWDRYEAALYQVFEQDIIEFDLSFRGHPVNARRAPEHERKWACFWHLISEGRVEDDRLPDLRRCERIRWVRWVIENADVCGDIDVWQNRRNGETNWLLWYREEYLVILAARTGYFLLRTAFCTDREHRREKLRRERDT
ncbi:hypothetical protein [Salipiger bermudensis]|uniref:hypothetical protein n=1 Tax=Salipiger bermudensis TaxID=344736 RepID=UPI001CD1B261|nr:hypothetical protein [Salipiger bermudensis]MCA0961763.1 hypothetical protein [Salipiger bermudensis]